MNNVEITKVLLGMSGLGEEMIEHVTDRLGHDFRYAINSEKAKKEFGWGPRMDFKESMQATWDYYASVTL